MQFELLADRPAAVNQVAQWYFDEWGATSPFRSAQEIVDRINGMLNRDKIPVHILAVENDRVIGVVQLKIREMDIYPDREHWLGGLYVSPDHRGKDVGSKLIAKAIQMAANFDVKTLYLQTENLGGGVYLRHGWKPLEKTIYNGLHVLVMERAIAQTDFRRR